MSATSAAKPMVTVRDHIQDRLRDNVLAHIRDAGLESPDRLAEKLETTELTASALLNRKNWSIDTAIWVIERLELPIEVDVRVRERT